MTNTGPVAADDRHELGNLLTAMVWLADSALKESEDPVALRRLLEELKAAAEQAVETMLRQPLPDPPEVPFRSSSSVLLVDDESSLRRLFGQGLRDAGLEVLEARDALSALALYARQPEPPGLLVTDLGLPDLDGVELARRLRILQPDLPVIYVSGHPDCRRRAGLGHGAEEHLAKPLTKAHLLERVRHHLGS